MSSQQKNIVEGKCVPAAGAEAMSAAAGSVVLVIVAIRGELKC